MQNRTFLVLLRPIFGEKMKTASPKGNWMPKLRSRCRDSAWKRVWISDVGLKIRLNFGENFFFGDHLFLDWKSVWISDFSQNFRLNFKNKSAEIGWTMWFWFKNNENSGQGCLQFSHPFKKAPPPLFQILATRLCLPTIKYKLENRIIAWLLHLYIYALHKLFTRCLQTIYEL